MKHWMLTAAPALFIIVLFSRVTLAADDDQAKAEAILDKAIKAHGGEENLKKLDFTTMEDKGEAYLDGKVIGFKNIVHRQGADHVRTETTHSHEGEVSQTIRVICGDKGWYSEGGTVRDIGDEIFAEDLETAQTE